MKGFGSLAAADFLWKKNYVRAVNNGWGSGNFSGYYVFGKDFPHITHTLSIFINNIKAVNTKKNLLVKFADDITISLLIEANVG